jgi:UDP-3-O-[3-hydroxymyristoyl] glucosamine N-acyltransferase
LGELTGSFSARDVVRALGAAVHWTTGDLDRVLGGVASLGTAGPTSLTYCRYDGEKLSAALKATAAGAIIVPDVAELQTRPTDAVLIAVAKPRLAFITAVIAITPKPVLRPGIAATAIVDPGAFIDPQARIDAGAIIGPGCVVGARTSIGAHAVLERDVRIGADCVIDPGCVLGLEGFSFERDAQDRALDLPHLGGLTIGNDVRVGSQCCIDRGTLDDTVIEDGVRIDNHTQISHNCRIGARSVLCSFVVLGGSVSIGPDTWISPHVAIRNQAKIGGGAVLGLGAVVMSDVAAGDNMLGNPARRVPPLKGVRSTSG